MNERLFKISFFVPHHYPKMIGAKTKVYQCVSNKLIAEYTLAFYKFDDAYKWAQEAQGKYVDSDSIFTIEEKKN